MSQSANHRSAHTAESELAAILQSAHDAIMCLTLQGVVTSCNPAASRLYGYRPDEIVGRPAQVLYMNDQRNEESEVLRRIAAGEHVDRTNVGRRRKDGSTVKVSLTAVPVADAAGVIVGAATITPEVIPQSPGDLEEETAEAALDSDRQAAGPAQDLDVDSARRAAGAAQDKAAPDTHDLRIDADRRDARAAHDAHEMKIDFEHPVARGTWDQYDSRRDGTRPETHDRQERLRAQLQQAQRLENLGQLAGGVAHDFNNLLAVILNYASFISDELATATESNWPKRLETARGDLDQIEQAANRAARLTRQLLAFARREVVRPQVLNLDTVITAVQEMLGRTLGEHVELVVTPSNGLWPVLADPGQLEQVLVNLAVNARDAMPAGGTLTIDTANVNVDADSIAGGSKSRPGRNVRLRVSDTGTGMTRYVVEHAFEPFFTTKQDSSGTGLGLATVYGILSQADGDIQIYSEPGSGTTFSIMLPVTDEAPAEIAEFAAYRRDPAGETVLVVEDEAALRVVTERIFTRNGYHVITAANGHEALDIAREHPGEVHLLVTDVVMPHMLGKEVAERMRAIKPEIEVLYMSGYAQPVLASQGRLEPGVALVEKPFSEADLLAKAAQVLNGHFRGYETVPEA